MLVFVSFWYTYCITIAHVNFVVVVVVVVVVVLIISLSRPRSLSHKLEQELAVYFEGDID